MTHSTPLIQCAPLRLKQKPTGQYYLVGKWGDARVVIQPLPGASSIADDQPTYALYIGARTPAKGVGQ